MTRVRTLRTEAVAEIVEVDIDVDVEDDELDLQREIEAILADLTEHAQAEPVRRTDRYRCVGAAARGH